MTNKEGVVWCVLVAFRIEFDAGVRWQRALFPLAIICPWSPKEGRGGSRKPLKRLIRQTGTSKSAMRILARRGPPRHRIWR